MRGRQASPARLLARIRDHDLASRSDGELRAAASRLQTRAAHAGEEDLLPECFAIVSEAVDRRLGVWRMFDDSALPDRSGEDSSILSETAEAVSWQRRHRRAGDILLPAVFYASARRHDGEGRLRFRATGEQLLAGIALFRGRVAQMDAGEGKTVAIAFAAALHALLGRRVHVVTANDYLAERDAALLEPVYRSLGISSGAVPAYMEEAERRHVYRRSIVYGAMRELGFDYLRDNLKASAGERVQQSLDVAIVDEADHALIDEAFTPLIISGNPVGGSRLAARVNGAVSEMIARQRQLVSELAGGAESLAGKPKGLPTALATLLLADPDSPALSQQFAARPRLRRQAAALAEDDYAELSAGLYYAVHPGGSFVTLTEQGRKFLEGRLGPFPGGGHPDSRDGEGPRWQRGRRADSVGRTPRAQARRYALENQVSQALTAHLLLKRDVDYLVDAEDSGVDDGADDGGIVLIDPHTGRPKPGNIYQHGLQAAVEAREGVPVEPERETLAQVSVSGFVSGYRRLAGITGTAAAAAGEFRRKYGLDVTVVKPTHPPMRTSLPPVVYLNREDKLAAVVDEIAARHRTGQPVLTATRTVDQSEELGRLLQERGVPHRVLNAVTTHAEARIVRDAGAFGAVTVATHIAGRGTDILLEPGLNARIARQCAAEIRRMLTGESGLAAVEVRCPSPEQSAALRDELACDGALIVAVETGGAVLRVSLLNRGGPGGGSAGSGVGKLDYALGLCVIATEIHDSARIALQLDGRSGRQGQFGLTRAFLSLEDRLVNLDAEAIQKLSGCRGTDEAGRMRYSGPEVARRIERLQATADREGEAQRALMQDYAAELDRQTSLYYRRRQQLVETPTGPHGMTALCREAAERVAARLAAGHLGPDFDGEYGRRFSALAEELRQDYAVDCSPLYGLDLSLMPDELAALLNQRLQQQADQLGQSEGGSAVFPEAARLLYLQVCGDLWPGHIALLRDSLASQLLSGYGHKSAVAQYIRRCGEAWRELWDRVDAEFLSRITTLPLSAPDTPQAATVSEETELLLTGDAMNP